MIPPGMAVAAALALPLVLPAATPNSTPSGSELRSARPIRTNEPGTGVFIGSGTLGRLRVRREATTTGETLLEAVWLSDFRHTPATHWVLGVQLPVIHRSLRGGALDDASADGASVSGLGDVVVSAKYRFFRTVGRWSDRHAAVEVSAKLPTGSTSKPVDPAVPLPLRRRVQPGTGSTDFIVDLVYQEGRRRFVYGGDLAWVLTTADETGYEFGDEVRLSLDVEYILLPIEYRRPGQELFVLLEATVLKRRPDRFHDASLAATGRTEVLLAPAIQYIATERLLVSFSAQFPVYIDTPVGGLKTDFDVLAEFRFAF